MVAKTQDGKVIGFSHVGKARDEDVADHFGEVSAIYLLKDFQGKGIGRRLFQLSLERLKVMSFKSALLWVLRDNLTASFYQKMGGQETIEKEDEIGDKTLIEDRYEWRELKLSLEF